MARPLGYWKHREPKPLVTDSESEDEQQNAQYSQEMEPQSYSEALEQPNGEGDKWHEAALEEINAHLTNGTWSLVPLPPGEKAIGSKWVFKVKHNADGSIEHYKACIVAKGFSQRPGQDYFETFASTMHQSTIRTILALAAIEDLNLCTVDISHAFINSDIDAEVYMKQPEGFEQGGSEYVCKLNKSLYGLKQSPRLWSEKLATVMEGMNFHRLHSDPSVYLYARDDVRVIIPVFVDDITIASKSVEKMDQFVEELSSHFKLRDLGETSFLLGVEIK